MNSKIKTIIGLLLFIVLVTGAYYAYNALSNTNPPDISFPEYNNKDISENPSTKDSQAETAGNTDNTDESNNLDKNDSEPAENDGSQASEETGQDEPKKLEAFDFTVYDKEGQEVQLSEFFGKPIIVNFWATWCPYCIDEMPLFEENFNKYKDDIHFLMVDSVDGQRETKEKGEKFIKDKGYTFPVYFDLDLDATYTYQAYSLPTTLFIDKDGYLIAYHPGMLNEDLLKKGIELILE